MMETISILTVSVLPGLIYVCLGISLILKRRKETDEGENRTMSDIRKDYVVFYLFWRCAFSQDFLHYGLTMLCRSLLQKGLSTSFILCHQPCRVFS